MIKITLFIPTMWTDYVELAVISLLAMSMFMGLVAIAIRCQS